MKEETEGSLRTYELKLLQKGLWVRIIGTIVIPLVAFYLTIGANKSIIARDEAQLTSVRVTQMLDLLTSDNEFARQLGVELGTGLLSEGKLSRVESGTVRAAIAQLDREDDIDTILSAQKAANERAIQLKAGGPSNVSSSPYSIEGLIFAPFEPANPDSEMMYEEQLGVAKEIIDSASKELIRVTEKVGDEQLSEITEVIAASEPIWREDVGDPNEVADLSNPQPSPADSSNPEPGVRVIGEEGDRVYLFPSDTIPILPILLRQARRVEDFRIVNNWIGLINKYAGPLEDRQFALNSVINVEANETYWLLIQRGDSYAIAKYKYQDNEDIIESQTLPQGKF